VFNEALLLNHPIEFYQNFVALDIKNFAHVDTGMGTSLSRIVCHLYSEECAFDKQFPEHLLSNCVRSCTLSLLYRYCVLCYVP